MIELKSLARVLAILYCFSIYYCSAITHKVCVELSGRGTYSNINVESESKFPLYSELRKELVTRKIITSSDNFYFTKKNGNIKIEPTEEDVTSFKTSKQCVSLKNPNDQKIKICKLSGTDNSENNCIMTNINTQSATGLKVSMFRHEMNSNLLQAPPCVDWRFVQFLAKKEDNSIEKLNVRNLLEPGKEDMMPLTHIIFDNTVYALNFFDVNHIDISANRGSAYEIYDFTINPYLLLEDLRKLLNGTIRCEGTSIPKIFNANLEKEQWRVVRRDHTWQNDGNFLNPNYTLDPDLVLDIRNERITPIWDVMYTARDKKVYIDYHNILSDDLQFIGMKTDFIWNEGRTVGVKALKRTKSDPCIDPINLANLRTISEKHPSYMNNVILAENDTHVIFEVKHNLLKKDKLYHVSINDHNEKTLMGVLIGEKNEYITIDKYFEGEHITLKMLDPTITELSMKYNKMQFELAIQEVKKKRQTRSIRVNTKDTKPGDIVKSDNSKEDPSTYNRVYMDDYDSVGSPEKVVFFILIFKDHEVALRTLRLVPQNIT